MNLAPYTTRLISFNKTEHEDRICFFINFKAKIFFVTSMNFYDAMSFQSKPSPDHAIFVSENELDHSVWNDFVTQNQELLESFIDSREKSPTGDPRPYRGDLFWLIQGLWVSYTSPRLQAPQPEFA